MSVNDTTTYLTSPGRTQRLALIMALGLLAANLFALQTIEALAPMMVALSCVLAPIAALTGLLPRRALVPPVIVEANVVYRPLPERWVRMWMLAAPACWLLAAPLAILAHENGVFIAAGVGLVCAIVALELAARVSLEGVSFSVDEGGIYCASTMRRPVPWTAVRGVRQVGRGDSAALVIETARPRDYVQLWLALVAPSRQVRLTLADMTPDERRLVQERVLRRLERSRKGQPAFAK
ncbi:hypothetical protein [Phenylobacterium sp.]|jgi:hypothetical protein|uniref:hypothetical protein n=1 Tax=Phenylobacterium sp. TaxID=1871053 RepID=UPI002E34DC4C|nr:hypothetical protein [Phenylobacterium sp.]HEX2558720.1 hypothetical protein [Phenylobacterium sp.]